MTALSLAEFRVRFPVVASKTYLNNCSQGALSRDVEEALTGYLRSWHEEGSPWEAWSAPSNSSGRRSREPSAPRPAKWRSCRARRRASTPSQARSASKARGRAWWRASSSSRRWDRSGSRKNGTGRTNVKELDVDFLVTGLLKYLLGPSGIAFLYVRRELVERLEPTMTGWFGRLNPFEFRHDRLDWSPSARRFESGTPPIPNAYGALAGIELLQRVSVEAVESHIAALTGRAIRRAHEAGYVVLASEDARKRGPLVVIRSTNAQDLAGRLLRRGVITSARGNGVRLAFHGYNTAEDVDRAFEALAAEDSLLERAPRRDHVVETA